MDFTIFYKDCVSLQSLGIARWDCLISAYNTTDRVTQVFAATSATHKQWVIHREYEFKESEYPRDGVVFAAPDLSREDDFVHKLLDSMPPLVGKSVCVDISGFMRPHLMFLVRLLASKGLKTFDVLYSEPAQYRQRERTVFSAGNVTEVRQVAGFEGVHQFAASPEQELLILGVGYESELVRHVAESKKHARKIQLFGFPALQADFYQENVLNARRAAEEVSALNKGDPLFAPACDPFVTAAVLDETIKLHRQQGVMNFYLCPLSTRPQALGFALWHMFAAPEDSASVVYPFADRYSKDAASGLGRLWRYRIELP